MDENLFHGNLVTTNRILYTPSAFAKSSLLHLQEIGMLKAQKPHTSSRKNLASYLIFIVEHGSGYLEYGGQKYQLTEGDCVFIDCKKAYSHYTSDRNLWQLCWAHFYGPNMNSIYDKYVERGGFPAFHPDNIDSLLSILHELYEVAESNEYVKDMMIHEKLSSLLTIMMKESWHPEKSKRCSPKRHDLQTLKEYLDTNYIHKISLDSLSDKFFINKYYLTRIFKEQYGNSINNYLLQKRITHAKQMLRFTDLNIEAICIECGIDDANYFSRVFKKVEGVAPGEYRKMW